MLYRVFVSSNFYVIFLDEWIVLSAFDNMSTDFIYILWKNTHFLNWNPTLIGYNWTSDSM
jgi:hypothetical protein